MAEWSISCNVSSNSAYKKTEMMSSSHSKGLTLVLHPFVFAKYLQVHFQSVQYGQVSNISSITWPFWMNSSIWFNMFYSSIFKSIGVGLKHRVTLKKYLVYSLHITHAAQPWTRQELEENASWKAFFSDSHTCTLVLLIVSISNGGY